MTHIGTLGKISNRGKLRMKPRSKGLDKSIKGYLTNKRVDLDTLLC